MTDRHLNALIVVNPIAGTRSKTDLPALLRQTLPTDRISSHVVFTQAPGHATELARQAVAAGGYNAVVAVGGDGTVNEVATALCDTPVALGVIPCGSGNGLARHLHIPINTARAAELLPHCQREAIDYCMVNERPFFCTCGVGFDAQVSHQFAQADTRGLITYIRTTINEFFRYRAQHYHIEVDGTVHDEQAFVIAACNAAQYGNNALVAPRASIKDGLLDLTVIHQFNLGEAALLSARLFTSRIDQDRHVSIYRGRHIVIERDQPDMMHIDGEPLLMPARLDITCRPGGLNVLVPPSTANI